MEKLRGVIESLINDDTNWDIGVLTAKYKVHVDESSPERHKNLNPKWLEPFEAISIGSPTGQICFVPMDESSRDVAQLISNLPKLCREYFKLMVWKSEAEKVIGDWDVLRDYLQKTPLGKVGDHLPTLGLKIIQAAAASLETQAKRTGNIVDLKNQIDEMVECIKLQKKLIDSFENNDPKNAHRLMLVDDMIQIEKVIAKHI